MASSSSSSASPVKSLGFTIIVRLVVFCLFVCLFWGFFWGGVFCLLFFGGGRGEGGGVCDPVFFHPSTEVVTFCLRGWCLQGVFLLPAFIHLGHECQDLSSPWN